jgi:putative GTP pyrophosphokinase
MSDYWETVKSEYKDWYNENLKFLEITRNIFLSLVTSLLIDRSEFGNPSFESRVKERNSSLAKFESKYYKEYDENDLSIDIINTRITDLVGLRVICSYEDEIPRIEEILARNFTVITRTDKTLELQEMQFGYKGLHLDLKLKDDRANLEEYQKISHFQVEVQIRTMIQNAWSNLDHKISYKHSISNDLKRAIYRLAAIFEIADSEFIRIREETKRQEQIVESKIIDAKEKISSDIICKEEAKDYSKAIEEIKPLDSITLNKFLSMQYEKYPFYEFKIESMLQEIQKAKSDLGLNELIQAFECGKEKVEEYKDKNPNIYSMNPLTQLRHILYLFDKATYSKLLNENQKFNFDQYIEGVSKQ